MPINAVPNTLIISVIIFIFKKGKFYDYTKGLAGSRIATQTVRTVQAQSLEDTQHSRSGAGICWVSSVHSVTRPSLGCS